MRNRLAIILILLFFAPFGARGESVGLVLSGGGAKGLSHVGVIKALEENDIPIDYICGTSIGAIVGGLYAIGYSPDEMMALFKSAEFESWYKGLPEPDFATYFYRDEFQPAMVEFSFGSKLVNRKDDFGKEKRVRIDMPTSLVSPYPMDIAVLQIFTEASEAAGGKEDLRFSGLLNWIACPAIYCDNRAGIPRKMERFTRPIIHFDTSIDHFMK